jgi:hypothetical protein
VAGTVTPPSNMGTKNDASNVGRKDGTGKNTDHAYLHERLEKEENRRAQILSRDSSRLGSWTAEDKQLLLKLVDLYKPNGASSWEVRLPYSAYLLGILGLQMAWHALFRTSV